MEPTIHFDPGDNRMEAMAFQTGRFAVFTDRTETPWMPGFTDSKG
ncbi:hypothetical protein [Oricola thermophila]|nr:hypothetical protein [Oricola thermophila]